jgi:hypothetical protein
VPNYDEPNHDYPPDHNEHLWMDVPAHLREGLRAYMMEHRPTGGFLAAVLENDLFLASSRADPQSQRSFHAIAKYIYNCAPGQCYGSREKVDAWVSKPPPTQEGD